MQVLSGLDLGGYVMRGVARLSSGVDKGKLELRRWRAVNTHKLVFIRLRFLVKQLTRVTRLVTLRP